MEQSAVKSNEDSKNSGAARGPYPAQPFKDKEFATRFHRLMVRTRVLEEQLIKMAKTADGFFWIGGPGEESFNVSLGLQVQKGEGLAYDFLHLHYRSNGCALAMGAGMIDVIRQMRNVSTDPFSGGRNFVSHLARKDWNICPVTSTIETQFVVAPGTALAQRRARLRGDSTGITVVVGGDAGSAEGEFASSMVWSSRPGMELPMLSIITNNGFGISTPANSQHGERHVSDRAKAFGIQTQVSDGINPEKVWTALEVAIDYVRSTGKPYMLELLVSRLHGHSSSSGANRVKNEDCPIELFEKKLIKQGWLSQTEIDAVYKAAILEASEAREQARIENYPDPSTVLDHSFANGGRAGLPGRDC